MGSISDPKEFDWYRNDHGRIWEYGFDIDNNVHRWFEIDPQICGMPKGRQVIISWGVGVKNPKQILERASKALSDHVANYDPEWNEFSTKYLEWYRKYLVLEADQRQILARMPGHFRVPTPKK